MAYSKKHLNVSTYFKEFEGMITNAKGEGCQKVIDGQKIITQKILQFTQPALDSAWKDALSSADVATQPTRKPPYPLPSSDQHDDPSFSTSRQPYKLVIPHKQTPDGRLIPHYNIIEHPRLFDPIKKTFLPDGYQRIWNQWKNYKLAARNQQSALATLYEIIYFLCGEDIRAVLTSKGYAPCGALSAWKYIKTHYTSSSTASRSRALQDILKTNMFKDLNGKTLSQVHASFIEMIKSANNIKSKTAKDDNYEAIQKSINELIDIHNDISTSQYSMQTISDDLTTFLQESQTTSQQYTPTTTSDNGSETKDASNETKTSAKKFQKAILSDFKNQSNTVQTTIDETHTILLGELRDARKLLLLEFNQRESNIIKVNKSDTKLLIKETIKDFLESLNEYNTNTTDGNASTASTLSSPTSPTTPVSITPVDVADGAAHTSTIRRATKDDELDSATTEDEDEIVGATKEDKTELIDETIISSKTIHETMSQRFNESYINKIMTKARQLQEQRSDELSYNYQINKTFETIIQKADQLKPTLKDQLQTTPLKINIFEEFLKMQTPHPAVATVAKNNETKLHIDNITRELQKAIQTNTQQSDNHNHKLRKIIDEINFRANGLNTLINSELRTAILLQLISQNPRYQPILQQIELNSETNTQQEPMDDYKMVQIMENQESLQKDRRLTPPDTKQQIRGRNRRPNYTIEDLTKLADSAKDASSICPVPGHENHCIGQCILISKNNRQAQKQGLPQSRISITGRDRRANVAHQKNQIQSYVGKQYTNETEFCTFCEGVHPTYWKTTNRKCFCDPSCPQYDATKASYRLRDNQAQNKMTIERANNNKALRAETQYAYPAAEMPTRPQQQQQREESNRSVTFADTNSQATDQSHNNYNATSRLTLQRTPDMHMFQQFQRYNQDKNNYGNSINYAKARYNGQDSSYNYGQDPSSSENTVIDTNVQETEQSSQTSNYFAEQSRTVQLSGDHVPKVPPTTVSKVPLTKFIYGQDLSNSTISTTPFGELQKEISRQILAPPLAPPTESESDNSYNKLCDDSNYLSTTNNYISKDQTAEEFYTNARCNACTESDDDIDYQPKAQPTQETYANNFYNESYYDAEYNSYDDSNYFDQLPENAFSDPDYVFPTQLLPDQNTDQQQSESNNIKENPSCLMMRLASTHQPQGQTQQ